MQHKSPNARWLDNPLRRVRPEHLIHVRRAALGLDQPEIPAAVGADRIRHNRTVSSAN
jgi:hypothetical protein